MKKSKTLRCDDCGKELSGNDKIYTDTDGYVYCSKNCFFESNFDEETTAQAYIDELVECGEWDEY